MNRIQLEKHIKNKQSYLCVGLDTDPTKLPKHLKGRPNAIFEFNKAIIDATKDYCVSYKINTAFYEAQGIQGWEAMEQTVNYIPYTHLKIADAKRGDIGNTADQYARAFFEVLNFDAITISPYMGEDSVKPFLSYKDKWTIVLGLTSNKGSADFQRLMVASPQSDIQKDNKKNLYEKILQTVSLWGTPDNLMYVIGATQASDLERIRSIVPHHFLLVPGIGFQGGSLAEVSKYGMIKDGGLLVNASRAILFASDGEGFATAAGIIAAEYQSEMENYLSKFM